MIKHHKGYFIDDISDEMDPDAPGTQVRLRAAGRGSEMDRKVLEVAERDRARRPGHDPSIRVKWLCRTCGEITESRGHCS